MSRAVLCVFLIINVCVGHTAENGFVAEKDVFAARRDALMERIGPSIAVLQGMPDPRGYVPFRQDNSFYYLTGLAVSNALLLLDGSQKQDVLFLPSRNEKSEPWEGPSLYAGAEARTATGVDKVMNLDEFGAELRKRNETSPFVYTPFMPYETAATSRDRAERYDSSRLENALDGRTSREEAFRKKLKESAGASSTIKDLSPILDEMRRIKDAMEIDRLRTAGRIGALGLREAIRAAKPGMFEYQLAAVAEFVFMWHGAFGEAFFPIVGSGPNSCILHYYEKRRRMEAGDIVVMDFGPDYGYYASDITRTFPVSGKFSGEQAQVYGAVLEAQKAAILAVRPGATFEDLEDAAGNVLERHKYEKYTLHGIGHYVGMAVHDVGKFGPFAPGVVLAVEPGVYIPKKNIGVRIEDTVLVTEDGCEILSRDVPKEIGEIEQLMSAGSITINVGD